MLAKRMVHTRYSGEMARTVSLAGAVAPRAEARARVGFGPGGLAVRWRLLVQVAGRYAIRKSFQELFWKCKSI